MHATRSLIDAEGPSTLRKEFLLDNAKIAIPTSTIQIKIVFIRLDIVYLSCRQSISQRINTLIDFDRKINRIYDRSAT